MYLQHLCRLLSLQLQRWPAAQNSLLLLLLLQAHLQHKCRCWSQNICGILRQPSRNTPEACQCRRANDCK